MLVSAVAKAEALSRHFQRLGASRRGASLTLTEREAWEFLTWYRTQLCQVSHAEFDADLRKAHALKDPFAILTGFNVLGFPIEKAEFQELH